MTQEKVFPSVSDSDMWKVSEAFIKQYSPVSVQIDSYNAAIEENIPSIINEKGKIHLCRDGKDHFVEFKFVLYDNPTHKEDNGDIIKVTPKICADRSITYASGIYCDITYTGPDGQFNRYEKKHIGDIPVMVYSKLCNLYPFKHDARKLASLHENINEWGGYFLIKGMPKIIIPQIHSAPNIVHLYSGKATSSGKPLFTKYAEIQCTIGSGAANVTRSVQVGICSKTGLLHATIPYMNAVTIPLGIVFKALGVESNQDIISYIIKSDDVLWQNKEAITVLQKSLEHTYPCNSRIMALNYIGLRGKKFSREDDLSPDEMAEESIDVCTIKHDNHIEYAKHLLTFEFLSHIKIDPSASESDRFLRKQIFLGYMTRKVLLFYANIITASDRDHAMNKRIQTPGLIISEHFYKTFCVLIGKIIGTMECEMRKKKPIIVSSYITVPHIITTAFSKALTANKWATKGNVKGITQNYDNFNAVATLSYLRKLCLSMANDGGKIDKPRQLHNSQWALSCAWETPEGKSVGLVQNFAMASIVTVGCDDRPIIDFLNVILGKIPSTHYGKTTDQRSVTTKDSKSQTLIFVNGDPYGQTSSPTEIVQKLRFLRRGLDINPTISISYSKRDNEIHILTDPGRPIRGLAIINDGVLLYDGGEDGWMGLLEKGMVELIDKQEEEYLNVAVYPSALEEMPYRIRTQYTHCELSPDMIQGVGSCTSPKNDCNQAPRIIYQSSMAKQAVGIPGLNHQFHRKGKWHALVYPQRPIVSTRMSKILRFDEEPMGQNATIAVLHLHGLNQEDSLILHKEAVDRGFGNTYAYVSHEAIIKHPQVPGNTVYETFEIPNALHNEFIENVHKIHKLKSTSATDNSPGWCYVPCGIEVEKGDILIGMVITHSLDKSPYDRSTHFSNKTNISVVYDHKWPATVHSVYCGKNGDGYYFIRLVTRQLRKPVRGDKFAGCHGQKGTVGAILSTQEMPFFVDLGFTPTLLVNPLAFPSRMTFGMFMEAIIGVAMTASAMKLPEYNKDISEFFIDGFDPEKDYNLGISGDGTPFVRTFDIKAVMAAITKMGLDGFCETRVRLPDGRIRDTLAFFGIVYYQRLKHMVVDKIHARAKGGKYALTRQPTEGRKKKGGFRIGHMELDMLGLKTLVALREGVSIAIQELSRKSENLWSMNCEKGGIEVSTQIHQHECEKRNEFIVTLQDGRTVSAARYHPFYTNEENYAEVHELKVGIDKIACSLDLPRVSFEEDLKLCCNWDWNFDFFAEIRGDRQAITKYEIFRKSLCLARLVGLCITDGHAHKNGNGINIFLGHEVDCRTASDDIFRITGINITSKFSESTCDSGYKIRLPIDLAKAIRTFDILSGAKVTQTVKFPNFINEDTPLPILREFLGGLFGGDGHTCFLSTHGPKRGNKLDYLGTVGFSWSRDQENVDNLIEGMKFLQKLLLRFDIQSTISNPTLTTHSKQSKGKFNHSQVKLSIPLESLIQFSEKIGFRYCEHKSIRLSAGVSYRRFREGVLRQRQWICDRVDELIGYKQKKIDKPNARIEGLKKAVDQATNELRASEAILHDESIPTPKMAGRIISDKSNNEIRSETFPAVGDYLKEIGALDLFMDEDPDFKGISYGIMRSKDVVPIYYLKVIDVRETGKEVDMCDITVEGNESYIANGMIAHNCMFAQGIPEMVLDRILYQSDVYKMQECRTCGLPAVNDGKNVYCRVCQKSEVVTVQLPYGTKLLSEELGVLNLVPRVITLPQPIEQPKK